MRELLTAASRGRRGLCGLSVKPRHFWGAISLSGMDQLHEH